MYVVGMGYQCAGAREEVNLGREAFIDGRTGWAGLPGYLATIGLPNMPSGRTLAEKEVR